MTRSSRRRVVKDAAAPLRPGTDHPDAELLALGQAYEQAKAAATAANDAMGETEGRAFAAFPPPPQEARQWNPTRNVWTRLGRDDMNNHLALRWPAEASRIMEIWEADQAECERIEQEYGCEAARTADEAASKVEHDIIDRILKTPARTPGGLLIKARIAWRFAGPCSDDPATWGYEDEALHVLIGDIERMATA